MRSIFKEFTRADAIKAQEEREPALEPCPCCGAKAIFPPPLHADNHFVECTCCKLSTAIQKTKLMAAAKWNARYYEANQKEQP